MSPKRVKEADEQLRTANDSGYDHGLTVLQVKRCPWCGTPIRKEHVRVDTAVGRVFVYCGDPFAECPFARGGTVERGPPGAHRRRGDLPPRPGVRHRDRRQVRSAGPRGRGGVPVRLREPNGATGTDTSTPTSLAARVSVTTRQARTRPRTCGRPDASDPRT